MSYLVGKRDAEHANIFMTDVASRLATRVQLTTDGHAHRHREDLDGIDRRDVVQAGIAFLAITRSCSLLK